MSNFNRRFRVCSVHRAQCEKLVIPVMGVIIDPLLHILSIIDGVSHFVQELSPRLSDKYSPGNTTTYIYAQNVRFPTMFESHSPGLGERDSCRQKFQRWRIFSVLCWAAISACSCLAVLLCLCLIAITVCTLSKINK